MQIVNEIKEKIKERTIVILRFLRLNFIDLCHCRAKMHKETAPSSIGKQGLSINVVSLGRVPPN